MASPLKLWVGSTLAGLALVSVATLPPSVAEVRTLPRRTPEEVYASSLSADAMRTARMIQRFRWMDSLPALAVATARNGVAVGGDPALVDASQLELIRTQLLAELSRLQRGDGGMVVGFFVQPARFESVVRNYVDWRPRYELYAGRSGDTPYCLVLQVRSSRLQTPELQMWLDEKGELHSQLLKGCRIVAAYGLPGPQIREWLATDGYQYAEWGDLDRRQAEPRQPPRRDRNVRRVLGLYRTSLSPQRCVSGQADACADLVLRETADPFDPDEVASETAGFPLSLGATLTPSRSPILTNEARYLLSDLEHEYGADAFRAFWTSERAMPDAFQASFGMPLGDWTVRWVDEHIGLERHGPALPKGVWVETVLLVLLSGLAGGVWHHRRAVA